MSSALHPTHTPNPSPGERGEQDEPFSEPWGSSPRHSMPRTRRTHRGDEPHGSLNAPPQLAKPAISHQSAQASQPSKTDPKSKVFSESTQELIVGVMRVALPLSKSRRVFHLRTKRKKRIGPSLLGRSLLRFDN